MAREELKAQAFNLHFVEGKGQTEIAKLLGLPIGTVGNWLSVEKATRFKASGYQEAGDKAGTALTALNSPEPEVEQSDSDSQESGRDDLLRDKALGVLEKALRSKTPLPAHKIDAANKILGRLAKPKAEANLNSWQSQYEGMRDAEIGERLVTCAASLLGVDALQAILDRLKGNKQASVV